MDDAHEDASGEENFPLGIALAAAPTKTTVQCGMASNEPKVSITKAFHRDLEQAIAGVAVRYNLNTGGVGIAHQRDGLIVICRLRGDDAPPPVPES
jgi:hypothetical protein